MYTWNKGIPSFFVDIPNETVSQSGLIPSF